jgi:hypothetical protein
LPLELDYDSCIVPLCPCAVRCAGILARDDEPIFPGLSADDVLTLYFTRATNRPDVSTSARVLALLAFIPPLATTYRASWQSGGDDGDRNASERLIVTLAGTVNPDVAATLLSSVRVSVLPGGGLKDAGQASPAASIAGLSVGGTWGDASQPQFLVGSPLVALDYGTQPGLGPGDALALRFNQPVAQVPVASKQDLDVLLSFEPGDWATDYVGVWLDFMTLLVNVTSVDSPEATNQSSNATHRAATAVGALRVTVQPGGNLTSFDGTSLPSNASSLVTSGSWGDPVCDGGLHVYSSTALVVSFVRPPLATYTPDNYTIQVLLADGSGSVMHTLVVTAAGSDSSVGLPAGVPSTSLRYPLPGLALRTLYTVRVGPSVPPLPAALQALLPTRVPQAAVDIGDAQGEGSCSCMCSALVYGEGCGTASGNVMGVSPLAPQLPVIGT